MNASSSSPGFHTAHRPIVVDIIDHVDQTMHLLLPASIPLVPPHFFINSTTFCMNILRMKYNVFTIYDKTMIQKKRPTSRTQSMNDVSHYYENFHQHWVQYICTQHGICCLTYWHSSIHITILDRNTLTTWSQTGKVNSFPPSNEQSIRKDDQESITNTADSHLARPS